MKHIKIIYGDGVVESYYTDMCHSEIWKLAREKARAAGTYVRALSFVKQ